MMKYISFGLVIILFIANLFLIKWGVNKISETTRSIEFHNLESQKDISKSTDSLITLMYQKKSFTSESIELVNKKIDQVVNFEHEERRVWIDNMYSFATIVISVLALFTIFIPIVTHLSLAEQVKEIKDNVENLKKQKTELDDLLFVISKIDIYQFQSSILQIISPYQIRAATTRPVEFKKMFISVFSELRCRTDEIIENIGDERVRNGKVGDLLKTSILQFSLNIKGLYILPIFITRPEYILLNNLEISLHYLTQHHDNKVAWQDFGTKLDLLVARLKR